MNRITVVSLVGEFLDRVHKVPHPEDRLHRATWVQTELFLTFPPPTISCISLLPRNTEDTAGRFRVWLSISGQGKPILAWDRKVEGGFPELKVLVRLVQIIWSDISLQANRNRGSATIFSRESPLAIPMQSSYNI